MQSQPANFKISTPGKARSKSVPSSTNSEKTDTHNQRTLNSDVTSGKACNGAPVRISINDSSSTGSPVSDEELVRMGKAIAKKWAELKGIPEPLLADMDVDREKKLSRMCGAGFFEKGDIVYLNNGPLLRENLHLLKRVIPHEYTHGNYAKLRVRSKIQHPDRYKSTVLGHMKDLVINGEIGSILAGVTLSEPMGEKKLRKAIAFEFMDPPYIPPNIKKKASEILDKLFNRHTEVFTSTDEDYIPKLTDADKILIEGFLKDKNAGMIIEQFNYHDKSGELPAKQLAFKEAQAKLNQYFEAMLLRVRLLYYGAAVGSDKLEQALSHPLSPANIDMTPKEIDDAEKSLRGYLSTQEGNMRIQYSSNRGLSKMPNPDETFAYSLGAFEEREAEINSAEFMLHEINNSLHSDGEPQPSKLKEIESWEANIGLLTLAEKYVELTRKISAAPKNIQTIQDINKAKHEITQCRKRERKLKEEVEARKASIVVRVNDDGSTTRKLTDGEFELLFELPNKIADLKKLIDQKNNPRELLDFSPEHRKENERLIKEREHLLLEMKKLVPKTSFGALPQILFESDYEHTKYHENNFNISPETRSKMAGQLLGDLIDHAPVITGIFENAA